MNNYYNKIAIVGTSINLSDDEVNGVKKICLEILKDFIPIETTVITGGAKGVDTIASNLALCNGFATKPILPLRYEQKYYLMRNVEIAKECDKLFCITIPTRNQKCYHHKPEQDHEKTAGCWTMNKAIELQKPCKLLVTQQR